MLVTAWTRHLSARGGALTKEEFPISETKLEIAALFLGMFGG